MTLSLPPGVTALLGPNGAGKSTLIRALCGVVRPAQGTITVGGVDLAGHGRAGTRAAMGWLPQESPLPPRVRLDDAIRYAAWLKRVDVGRSGIDSVLDLVDLTDRGSWRVGRLSGGQQRRAALACALVGDPVVLLLDEPTTGLDPDQRERFLEVVRAVAPRATVVVSTHLMEDVVAVADRVAVLSHGRLAVSSTVAALAAPADRTAADLLSALRRAVTDAADR